VPRGPFTWWASVAPDADFGGFVEAGDEPVELRSVGPMARQGRVEALAQTDADNGVWLGRSVARRFVSEEGFVVLVGRTAADNDILTLKLASPRDFWLHVAAESGSHVVVRNPQGLNSLPRETLRFAAALAAGYSRGRHGGKVAVHVARCGDVSKPRGWPPGRVSLASHRTVHVAPSRGEENAAGDAS
jgi:hypothetical protein